MRFAPDYKAAAREKLIESSGQLAKTSGFAATGMSAFAAAAKVTTGALYSHFDSKSGLLGAVVVRELSRVVAAFEGKSSEQLADVLDGYLSPSHAAHPAQGCPLPALGPEIARADDETRIQFERLLQQLAGAVESSAGDREVAWSVLAQAVGGIVLARAVFSPELQQEILAGVRKMAGELIQNAVDD